MHLLFKREKNLDMRGVFTPMASSVAKKINACFY